MTKQIVLREIQKQDYKPLEYIICKTWKFDEDCTPKTAAILSRAYLSRCLTDQTFTRVAVVDGMPVGVIVGKNVSKHRVPLKYRMRAAISMIELLLTAEGRAAAKVFADMDQIDKDLLETLRQTIKARFPFSWSIPLIGEGDWERSCFKAYCSIWKAKISRGFTCIRIRIVITDLMKVRA